MKYVIYRIGLAGLVAGTIGTIALSSIIAITILAAMQREIPHVLAYIALSTASMLGGALVIPPMVEAKTNGPSAKPPANT